MRKNNLIEIYHNKKLNQISYERIIDKNKYDNLLKNRIGIEFKILDHFPIKYLDQFLGILIPSVLDSSKDLKKINFKNTYITKQIWHNEMYNIILNGYNYNPSVKYLSFIEKEFNIKFENKNNI